MPAPTPSAVSVEAVGTAWIEGTLYVRTITRWDDGTTPDGGTTQLVLRRRGGERTVTVPTVVSSSRSAADGGGGASTDSRLDVRHVGRSGWLPDAVWDVHARVRGSDGTVTVPVFTGLGARPALLAGRPAVAYRNTKGHLTVDTTGRLHFVVNDGRPRLADATVSASDGGARHVRVTMPLDGVRVHGRGSVAGTVSVASHRPPWGRRVAGAVRRRLAGASPAGGSATVTATRDDLTLSFDVTATPGRWRPSFVFAGESKAAPFLLTVPRTGPVTVEPLDEPPARAEDPLVTVVAVGRDEPLLEAAVRSVLAQTLPLARTEIIVVTDPGAAPAWWGAVSAARPDVRLVTASGGTATQRNAGLEAARGRYVHFLDADDRLAPLALEKLAETADATGADLVLGKTLGISRRRATPHAFQATVLSADTLDQRLFDVLTPHHLFRRAHLDDLGLRFPEGLPDDGDDLLTAELALRARRVAVLADSVYYESGVTGSGGVPVGGDDPAQGLDDELEAALRLAEVVTDQVPEGPRREKLLRRPAATLTGIARRVAALDDPEVRGRLAAEARDRFGRHWTGSLRRGRDERSALLLDTFLSGDGDALADLMTACHGDEKALRAAVDGGDLRYDVPATVQHVVPPESRTVSAQVVNHLMTSLVVDDGFARVAGWIAAPGVLPPPDGVRAVLRLRDTETEVELPVTLGDTLVTDPVEALPFTLGIDPAALDAPGRWDLYVAPVWAGHALPDLRFGSRRPTQVDETCVDVTGRALGAPDTVLYATASYGNLSVSHRDFLTADEVRLSRLSLDEDDRPEAVVDVAGLGKGLQVYADVDPAGSREAPHRLPWRRLDDRQVAARLPVPVTGDLRFALTVVHGDVRATSHVPEPLEPVRTAAFVARYEDGRFVVSRLPEGEPS
ncbi:glycosyltransferase family 2 protein [Isoptericola cucumis]|nr:glycosyltransferase family 2 protein [Isoptericola cucumis]